MKTKGINKNYELYNFKYGTQEYNEIKLKSMIDSCYAYGSIEKDSYCYVRYIKSSGSDLPENIFNEVYNEQCAYLKKHCTISHNVYTDGEGCTYNSLQYHD